MAILCEAASAFQAYSEWQVFQSVIIEVIEKALRSVGGSEHTENESVDMQGEDEEEDDDWAYLTSSNYHSSHRHLLRGLEVCLILLQY